MTVYGILIFLISTLAAVFSNSITMLIICRVVQGLGSAMVGATIVAIITITFPAKERGKALGVFISAVYFWLTAVRFWEVC
jgi:MFS family permease